MTERWRHAHCRHPWAMLVCNTHKNVRSMHRVCVQQKNVRATSECVHLLRRTHSSCCCVGANPRGTTPTTKRKNHHTITILSDFLYVIFDFSHQDFVHQFAFHQSSDVWVNASWFPEACSCSDSRWCLCVEFWIWVPVHREVVFPIVWERLYNLPAYSLRVHTAPSYSLEFQVGICNELLEFWLPATRNCLLHEFSSRPFSLRHFYDAFFQQRLVHDDGVGSVCQNSFLRRGRVNSVLCILFRSSMNLIIHLPRLLEICKLFCFVCIAVGEEDCMIFFFTFFSFCHQFSFCNGILISCLIHIRQQSMCTLFLHFECVCVLPICVTPSLCDTLFCVSHPLCGETSRNSSGSKE